MAFAVTGAPLVPVDVDEAAHSSDRPRPLMQGSMLWFNAEKGFGFIRTDDGERLYVERSAFRPEQLPTGRCAGLPVTFGRVVGDTGAYAVDVVFPDKLEPRRARLRHQRSGTSL